MSTIDLGDSPVGSTPTDAQKTQLRSSIGLGSADTVEFGAIIPPSGSTAEIDAIANAEVGSVVLNSDTAQYVQFTSANEYKYIGSLVSSSEYFVDPTNGDNSKGKVGVFPFATINAALVAASLSGDSTVSVVCLAGVYTEEDAFNSITTSASISITFKDGSFWTPTAHVSPLFDNTASNLNITQIGGNLTISSNTLEFWKGSLSSSGTAIDIYSCITLSITNPTFNITGGNGVITFKTKNKQIAGDPTREVISVSGGANVEIRTARFTQPASPSTTVPPFVEVSTADTNVSIVGARLYGYGLCEITDNSNCNIALDNCVSAGAPALFFFNQVLQSIAAPAGNGQNSTIYAVGFNAVDVAPVNITVNEDVGSLTVSTSAAEAIDKFPTS